MWILQSEEGTFRLTPGADKTAGRATRADFIVDAALVSRVHCRLTATDRHVEVEDLSSTNGIFVNDKKVSRANLATGDRLRVGRVELTIQRQKNSPQRPQSTQKNSFSAIAACSGVRRETDSSGAPDRSSSSGHAPDRRPRRRRTQTAPS